ncbi:MAG: class I SAM-dependent methyltransferase [Robiginitalea sp.]|jgi:SAM-dependent methyltransferase
MDTHNPRIFILLAAALLLGPLNVTFSQETAETNGYIYKPGDPNGTGKWYMGREIARVMGYQGMGWLDRPEREAEENTSKLLENMEIEADDHLVDIGAGSGYHVFQMAPMVPEGLVYAVDIQDEMLAELRRKKEGLKASNVRLVKGAEKQINLPDESVDKVLMVDVYHEFSYPAEMVASIKRALKPGGKVYLIEYRGEDRGIPIKKVHKMTQAQAVQEMRKAGFKLQRNMSNLPWQHCMVFVLE